MNQITAIVVIITRFRVMQWDTIILPSKLPLLNLRPFEVSDVDVETDRFELALPLVISIYFVYISAVAATLRSAKGQAQILQRHVR